MSKTSLIYQISYLLTSYRALQVGVDLVDVTARSRNIFSFAQFFTLFEKCFGKDEKDFITKYVLTYAHTEMFS